MPRRPRRVAAVLPPPGPPPGPPPSAAVDEGLLARVTKKLRAEYGIARLDDPDAYEEVRRVIPTGLPALDAILGGGIPLGRMVLVSGRPFAGKSTLAKVVARQAQQAGVTPFILDTEQAGSLAYDVALGVDPTRALVAEWDADDPPMPTLEGVVKKIIAVTDEMRAAGRPVLSIFDSVAATPLRAELLAEIGQQDRPGRRAAFFATHLPKLTGRLDGDLVGLLFVNQLREKIGAQPWEKNTYSPGGTALNHFARLHLEMSGGGQIKDKAGSPIGFKVYVQVTKAQIPNARPRGRAELALYFDPPRLVDPGAESQA